MGGCFWVCAWNWPSTCLNLITHTSRYYRFEKLFFFLWNVKNPCDVPHVELQLCWFLVSAVAEGMWPGSLHGRLTPAERVFFTFTKLLDPTACLDALKQRKTFCLSRVSYQVSHSPCLQRSHHTNCAISTAYFHTEKVKIRLMKHLVSSVRRFICYNITPWRFVVIL
jgi:hypothetical protein